MEENYYEVNVEDLEVEGNVDFVDDSLVSSNQKMATMPVVDEYYGEETVNSSGSNAIALYITIGVCIVIGIVLGIILGKKSALK